MCKIAAPPLARHDGDVTPAFQRPCPIACTDGAGFVRFGPMRKLSLLNPERGCIELSYTTVTECAWCESRAIDFNDPLLYPVACVRAIIPGVSLNAAHVCPRCQQNVMLGRKEQHKSFDVLEVKWSRKPVNIGQGFVPPQWAPHYLACVLASFWDRHGVESKHLREFVFLLTLRRGVKLKRRQSAGRKGGGR